MQSVRMSRRATLVSLAAFGALAWAPIAANAQSIKDRVLQDGKISIGIHNEKPWGYVGEDGKVAGLGPDTLRAVLGPLGLKEVDFVVVDWPALIPSLMSKRIDVIASGMAVTPVRCEQVIFSNPDLAIGDALLVVQGNPKNIHSYDDIAKNPGLRIGGTRGSTNIENAVKAGIPKDRALQFDGGEISALLAGRVDAIAWSVPTALGALKDPNLRGRIERALPFSGLKENGRDAAFYTAIEFRPEDADLRDMYNQSLAKLRANGTILKIAEKYGLTDADLAPSGLTAKDLCPQNYR